MDEFSAQSGNPMKDSWVCLIQIGAEFQDSEFGCDLAEQFKEHIQMRHACLMFPFINIKLFMLQLYNTSVH